MSDTINYAMTLAEVEARYPFKPDEIVTVYGNDQAFRLHKHSLIPFLKEQGTFTVHISFIDPRSDTWVSQHFLFYPNEQITYRGHSFIAEHLGLPLHIPSDPGYWCGTAGSSNKTRTQPSIILVNGGYASRDVELAIGAIRIDR